MQCALADNLSKVLAIYNQSIAGKQATANLEPVTYEERALVFRAYRECNTTYLYCQNDTYDYAR
jgi:phosphinothricin acetyltransferase